MHKQKQYRKQKESAIPLRRSRVTAANDSHRINDVLDGKTLLHMDIGYPLMTMINESGDSLDDCLAAVQTGRRLPSAPHISSATGQLSELDGRANGGRATLIGDLIRPTNPTHLGAGIGGVGLLQEANQRFTFRFPDGRTLVAQPGPLDNEGVRRSCTAITDRIETLCSTAHQKQLSSLYFALSQSGAGGNLKHAFLAQGIDSDELMTLTFTLAKEDATGAVTFTYTQPEGFLFRFHWTTTVALDGTVTGTPMVIEQPQ